MADETRATPVFVLIPAYQPGGQLPEMVRRLAESPGVCGVVVVDDGSGEQSRAIFDAVGRIDKAHVLRHVTNLGKGAALKTGMNYGACAFRDAVGAVTADADGQHRVEDVLAVAEELRAHPDHLVLGSRAFQGAVPFKSRLGNTLTRGLMRLVVGQRLTDTQTGLRGVPLRLIPRLLKLPSTRYEFELDMLLVCKHEHIPIAERRIETIYLEDNRFTHFNPVLDSMRIYFVLLRFLIVSLISSGLDNIVFALVYGAWPVILGSQVAGRIGGAIFNYIANKRVVFHSDAPNVHAAPKYVLLVVFSGGVSYGLILLLVSTFGMKVVVAKVLAETLLFTFNFVVQRDFIFTRRGLLVSA
jgi:putative flippase GtrA